jgi:hypothetical protein
MVSENTPVSGNQLAELISLAGPSQAVTLSVVAKHSVQAHHSDIKVTIFDAIVASGAANCLFLPY